MAAPALTHSPSVHTWYVNLQARMTRIGQADADARRRAEGWGLQAFGYRQGRDGAEGSLNNGPKPIPLASPPVTNSKAPAKGMVPLGNRVQTVVDSRYPTESPVATPGNDKPQRLAGVLELMQIWFSAWNNAVRVMRPWQKAGSLMTRKRRAKKRVVRKTYYQWRGCIPSVQGRLQKTRRQAQVRAYIIAWSRCGKEESPIIDIGWIAGRYHFVGSGVFSKTRMAGKRFLRFMYLLWHAVLWIAFTRKENPPRRRLVGRCLVRALARVLVKHALNKSTRTQPALAPRRQWRQGRPSCKENPRVGAHI